MKLRYLFAALCLCLLLASPAAAAGGSGTAADPYVIQTPAELQSISNNLAAYYVLGNDIDMSAVTSWTPIGTNSAPFTGSLDGNNYIISNLKITLSSNLAGLFGNVVGANFKNLNLENIKFTFSGNNAGILIGNIYTNDVTPTIITNCNIKSSILINSNGYSGLLLGGAGGGAYVTISDCGIYDSILISNGQYVGLLQGAVASGTTETVSNIIIKNSIISGSSNVGGCFASVYAYASSPKTSLLTASNIFVENCLIRATSGTAGGIIGNHATAYSSYTLTDSTVKDSSILGTTYAGGLAT